MAFNSFFANPPANSSNANPNAGGLFGLSQNTNNITQSNTTAPSLFGNTNPAPNPLQPPTSVLGGGQQGGGSLLSSRPNTLTSTAGVGTGITQLEAHEQFLKIAQGVETIYQAWNPTTKNCRFQVGFFFGGGLLFFALIDVFPL
jgi:nuclear pore complex protein Nup54